jgi:aminotransferase in exopolysaccharide biosynthesis
MDGEFDELILFIREIFHKPEGVIPLHEPVFIGNEIQYVNNCISSTFVSSVGKYVDEFEIKTAEYTKSKHAIASVNGTAALHIALKLAGVNNGDEVITQPLTFIATANAISYCNANPVFIDVDKDTMGLSPEKLESFLKKNTRYNKKIRKLINKESSKPISAIVPMHTFGIPCRIEEIIEIADRYYIPVIEDAAESLGSRCNNQHTGTFGKIGVLSFNGNKIITTGGGGMILTDDIEIAKLAKHLTTQAKVPHPWEFFHDQIGYNFRMPNINAALGVAQIEMLDEFVRNKRNTSALYQTFFKEHNIHYFAENKNCHSNYWLNTIALPSKTERDSFLKASNSKGVMTRPAWTLMCNLPMYSKCQRDDLENAIELESTVVNLPSSYRKKVDLN